MKRTYTAVLAFLALTSPAQAQWHAPDMTQRHPSALATVHSIRNQCRFLCAEAGVPSSSYLALVNQPPSPRRPNLEPAGGEDKPERTEK